MNPNPHNSPIDPSSGLSSPQTPQNAQLIQPPPRSRFTILADITETTSGLQKTEEPSLLANYLRDLHEMKTQADKDKENKRNELNKSLLSEQPNPKRTRLNPSLKLYTQKQEPDYPRKGSNFPHQKPTKFSRSGSSNLPQPQTDPSHTPSISTYKMRIDLMQPIENWPHFHTIQRERLTSQTPTQTATKVRDQMLFYQAIQQSRHRHYR